MSVRGLYAKSARSGQVPEPLTEHLLATRAAAQALRRRVGLVSAGGLPLDAVVPGGFWAVVETAALTHDLGKVADGFQAMLTGRARNWGHRHEVLSLGFLPGLLPPGDHRLWVATAVVTHHRALSDPAGTTSGASVGVLYQHFDAEDLRTELGPINETAVGWLYTWLVRAHTGGARVLGCDAAAPAPGADLVPRAHELFNQVLDRWEYPVDPTAGLAMVLVQGALTLADHLSSAHGTLHERQPVGVGFPARLAARLGGAERFHPHQRHCHGVDGHLLLRSPTGSGKTEAGLLWAARQVATLTATTGGIPRVVLTLPYLASINAMAGRLGDLFGDEHLVGVAHSRAASYHLANAIGTDDGAADGPAEGAADDHSPRAAAGKAVSRAAATRLFRETVRVTTPYQLLRAALAGPAHAGILLDLANSVIVLDELHAYDATRLGYILASAGLWQGLGCRIAILSATLPTALADLAGEALGSQVTTVTGPVGAPRHRIRLREHGLTDQASLDEITGGLLAGRAVLVVANNVAQAQTLFDTLAPVARERHGEDAALLLHSRFRRGNRHAIEQAMTRRYGAEAARRNPGLVVATQVVEVSLDLDLDVLFTAGAPLEALLQRFGRVNRRGSRPPADVVICQPGYGPRRDDRTGGRYADGIYPAEPVEHGLRILARHDGQPVDETQATGWLDEVYASAWGATWRAEVTRARAAFERDFLHFGQPLVGRDELAERFDELFEGTEAILADDREDYAERLGTAPTAADRLLGEEYLIPLPYWADRMASWDRRLRVRVVEGDYDRERGLLAVRPIRGQVIYQPGEVL